MTINRMDFLQAIRRVAIFANKTTHQVRLRIAGSELTVNAEDLDFANEATERLTCSYQGEDIEIGFNSRFLSDMLNNLGAEEIVLGPKPIQKHQNTKPNHESEIIASYPILCYLILYHVSHAILCYV